MDQNRFDQLARVLGAAGSRRAGLRAALGGILGIGGIAALDPDAEAKRRRNGGGTAKRRHRSDDAPGAEAGRKKRRRKKCRPACAPGQTCVKGACRCDNGGVVCGANCCLTGQTCDNGVCVAGPDPTPTCIAAGEPCKNVGRRCCDGRTCASGQGGDDDVACYVPKTGRCERTADCVYGMACRSGRCEPPQPGDLGQPCDAAAQQLCTTPGAVCTNYTGADAPAGAHCSLPLQTVCTGDPDCTCYRCWYTQATLGLQGREDRRGRGGRASANTKACCHAEDLGCAVDQDCCLGLNCVDGTCTGTLCTPDDAAGCSADVPCCNPAATCVDGTCTTCGPATCPNGCCRDGQCVPYGSQAAGACGTGGLACTACPTATCKQATCASGVCGQTDLVLNTVCDRNGGTGNGYCNGSGTCVECTAVGQCTNTITDCQDRACSAAGACVARNKANGTACSSGGGTLCYQGACSACSVTSCANGCCSSGSCVETGVYCRQNDGTCSGTACAANERCAASCEVCDVCTDGSCDYTSIKAAYEAKASGSVIRIAPGTYTEDQIEQYGLDTTGATALKDMTFQRCGDYGTVLWQNTVGSGDPLVRTNLGDSYQPPFGSTPTLTFIHLDFNVRQDPNLFIMNGAFRIQGGASSTASIATRSKIVLKHCRFDGQTLTPILALRYTDVVVEDTTFANGTMRDGHFGGIVSIGASPTYPNNTVVVKRSTFTDTIVPTCPGAIKAGFGQVTLEDTTVSGNSCTPVANAFLLDQLGGAGVFIDRYCTLTMSGTSSVTGNALSATGGGSGVMVEARDGTPAPSRLTGVTSARVFDNSPAADNCSVVTVSGGGYATHPVSCDAWCVPAGTTIDARSCSLCCSGSCSGSACS